MKIRYEHPLLEEICADTYGVMIYQEQVMAAAKQTRRLLTRAGRSSPARDGQEGQGEDGEREKEFHRRLCAHEQNSGKKANAIFDLLEKFAGYGFNKSHSAAYGLISYHTAYLKAHYPVEFMAGLLSNEINNTEKDFGFRRRMQTHGHLDSAAGCQPERFEIYS